MPVLSVITVVYNSASVIERTLINITGQTYPHIEYVIVDGKSKDGTLDIIDRYRDKISVLVSEPDKGLYDAMNKGISLATGDYICFMNAGDTFCDLHTVEDIFKHAGDADFIYGLTRTLTEEGKELPWHKPTPTADKLSPASFMNGMVICHQAMIVRRSMAARYDLQWKIAADIDWSIKSLQQCRTKYFTGNFIINFLHGGLSHKNQRRAWKERFHISRQHFGWFRAVWEQISKM